MFLNPVRASIAEIGCFDPSARTKRIQWMIRTRCRATRNATHFKNHLHSTRVSTSSTKNAEARPTHSTTCPPMECETSTVFLPEMARLCSIVYF